MAPKCSQLPWMWMVMADIRGRELSIYLLHLPRITRICLWLNQRYCRCSVFQELHQIDSTGMPGSAPAKPSGPHIRHENDQQKTWKKHHPKDSKGMCIWHHMTYVCRHCAYCIYCMYIYMCVCVCVRVCDCLIVCLFVCLIDCLNVWLFDCLLVC